MEYLRADFRRAPDYRTPTRHRKARKGTTVPFRSRHTLILTCESIVRRAPERPSTLSIFITIPSVKLSSQNWTVSSFLSVFAVASIGKL